MFKNLAIVKVQRVFYITPFQNTRVYDEVLQFLDLLMPQSLVGALWFHLSALSESLSHFLHSIGGESLCAGEGQWLTAVQQEIPLVGHLSVLPV